MNPTYYQSQSTTNHYTFDVVWDVSTLTLRVAPFSGTVAGHRFAFTEEYTYRPRVGTDPVSIMVYLVHDPTVNTVDMFIDERHPNATTFSPEHAGLQSLAMLTWADWNAVETNPFSFHATRCVLALPEVGNARIETTSRSS